jgi:hypothetical protein
MLLTAYLHGFEQTTKYQTTIPDNSLIDSPEIIFDGDRYFTIIRRDYSKCNNEVSIVYKEFSYVRSLAEFLSVNHLKESEVIKD